MPHFGGYVASDYPRFWALNRGAGRDQDHDSYLAAVLMKRGTERTDMARPPMSAHRTRSVSRSTTALRSLAGRQVGMPRRPKLSVAQLLAAKNTQPIRSLDDLTADTFESDEELDDFLAFTYAERHRDLA
jgi:hypothetical protein